MKLWYLDGKPEYVSDLSRLLFLLSLAQEYLHCTVLKWKHASGLQANSALKLFPTPFLLFSGDGRVARVAGGINVLHSLGRSKATQEHCAKCQHTRKSHMCIIFSLKTWTKSSLQRICHKTPHFPNWQVALKPVSSEEN